MNITLRQVQAFMAVAETGGFTAAARQMRLSQSAVSMLIRQMERECGVPLFDRTGGSVGLNEAGRQLLPSIENIRLGVSRLSDDADDVRNVRRGVLRIAATHILACTHIAPVLARFADRNPQLRIVMGEYFANDVVRLVVQGDAELGIGPDRPISEDIVASHFADVPIRLACAKSHPFVRRRKLSWEDILEARWVCYSQQYTAELEQIAAKLGHSSPMRSAVEVGSMTTALSLAGAGSSVVLVPEYARVFCSQFGVALLPLPPPAYNRRFVVFSRRDRSQSPGAKAFLAALKRDLGRLSA